MVQVPSKESADGMPLWKAKLQSVTGKTISTGDRVVFILFDTSGSMRDEDKLDKARQGTLGFCAEALAREFNFGLIAFDTLARLVLPPQRTHQPISDALAKLEIGGKTDMAAAIRLAENELLKVKRERIMCIITDGVPDDREATLVAAENARLRGIDIMAIGTDDADSAFLSRLVSRRELSRKVERQSLTAEITAMAALLPKPSGR